MDLWIHVVGWSLVHFLWQGATLAVACAGLLRLCRHRSANTRYAVACVALAVMAVSPAITVDVLLSSSSVAATTATLSQPVAGVGTAAVEVGRATDGVVFSMHSVWTRVDGLLPLVIFGWLAGVTVLLVRMAGGLWRVRRLRLEAFEMARSRWQAAAERVALRCGVTRVIRVAESARVDVPTVIGWLGPVVFLPVAAFSNLTPSQVEAILAHELAHVRRHDFVVNVLQTLVETLLFYHPGVWWVSRRIREEREHCCDDVAVTVCGDAMNYAAALTELEAGRAEDTTFALAVTGGSLTNRVRRVLRLPVRREPQSLSWAMTLALTLVLVAGVGGMSLPRFVPGSAAARGTQPLASPDTFDWQVHETDRFDIYYFPALADDLERVEDLAERAYELVSSELAHELSFNVPLVLFKTRSDFEQQGIAPGARLTGARSFSEPQRNRVVILVDEAPENLGYRITHEVTHIFMFDIIPRSPTQTTVPVWLDEGLADYVTGVWQASDLTLLRDVTAAENVPSMTDSSSMTLVADARLIYTLGHAVFDFVEEQWGKDDIRQFLLRFRQSPSGRVATVYDQAFGMTQAEFDSAFVQYLTARFGIQSTPSRGQPQGVTPLPPAGSAALMRNIELRFPTQGGEARREALSYVTQLELREHVSMLRKIRG